MNGCSACRRRVRRLPDPATAVARAAAVLGSGATVTDVAALAGLDEKAVAGAADALVGIQVLAADRALDFVHPVVRGAVYGQIPPLERQALHVKAAELLANRGAESEHVARHLLRLPPAADRARVAALRDAAPRDDSSPRP